MGRPVKPMRIGHRDHLSVISLVLLGNQFPATPARQLLAHPRADLQRSSDNNLPITTFVHPGLIAGNPRRWIRQALRCRRTDGPYLEIVAHTYIYPRTPIHFPSAGSQVLGAPPLSIIQSANETALWRTIENSVGIELLRRCFRSQATQRG
jgi:hypothetical protein